ncbi:MAG: pyridoxal phosphate-dependent aminotransferase [Bifidobacteriaceae bacterium]|jgi:aspartate/methionine/tyrosine aminotransferase|nr:pyridoxal phosphate-dependent aminotransferase [Bifidobacteriaceae bacterium]
MSDEKSSLSLSARIQSVSPSVTLAVDAKAKQLKASGVDIIGFGAGEPDFPTPAPIVEAAVEAARDPKNHRYTPTAGLPELREAVAAKTLRDSGYAVNPAQVVITNGGKQAVFESFQVLLDPGDEVILPTPFWISYSEAVKLAGGTPVPVFAGPDKNFIPTIEDLEAARTSHTKIVVLNSPTNPTGAVWSQDQVRALGEWALEHNLWVIADEIYEHITYDGVTTAHIGAVVPALRDRLIVLNGVAKSYAMTGWRVGWLIAPEYVAKAASKLQGHLTSNVSNVPQRAAIAALRGPLTAVAEMREAFDRRRHIIVDALNAVPGVSCNMPQGAFYALADVRALLNRPVGSQGFIFTSSTELAAGLLEQAHVAAVPGEAFGAAGYLRFSYATADDAIVEGMRRFHEWVAAN